MSNFDLNKSIYDLAISCRNNNFHKEVIGLAKLNSTNYLPLLEEASISGYYCEDIQDYYFGYKSCMELSILDSPHRELAKQNTIFYTKKLQQFMSCDYKQLKLNNIKPTFTESNPSICSVNNDLNYIVRTVDYRIDENRCYILANGEVATINYFVKDGKEYEITPPKVPYHNQINGFEDCRLFYWKNKFWFVATTRDFGAADDNNKMVLCSLDDNYNVDKCNILEGFGKGSCQKNWIPLIKNYCLFFITLTDPTTVCIYSESIEDVRIYRQVSVPSKLDLKDFRGGSQAISLPDGSYLYIIHQVLGDHYKRKYVHRFVVLSYDFNIEAVSEPFTFFNEDIEFCAGLALSNDNLSITFGVWDRQAHVVNVKLNNVLSFIDNGWIL